MNSLLLILGVLCLVYYTVIAAYTGKSSNFIKIWAAAGIVFLASFGFLWLKEQYGLFSNLVIPAFLKKIFLVCVLIGMVVFLSVEGLIFHAMMQKPDSKREYLIVLGAHVKGKTPSRALYKRIQRAAQYLKENPQVKAVLSGGKGRGEEITEAEAMRRYLEKEGISSKRLFLEEHSTSTKENIEFSMQIIQDFHTAIGVVTNDFHIFRSVAIGKKMGCTNIQGVPAAGDKILEINYLIREFFAVIKDKLMGNL